MSQIRQRTPAATWALLTAMALQGGLAQAASADHIPASAYRPGLPDVIQAQPGPDNGPVFNKARFAAAYAKAGRPPILVFWNRELTDTLRQTSVTTTQVGSVSRTNVTAEEVEPGVYEGSSTRVKAQVTRETRQLLPEVNRQPTPVERVNAQVRSGFMDTLLASGVALVDRNLVMRALSMSEKPDALIDTQVMEMASLKKYAKMIMEVTHVRDPASDSGWALRVTVKRVADGVIMLDHYENGELDPDAPPESPKAFVADPNGGFKAVAPTLKSSGARAAQQTLARLAESIVR
jgi:hypothetical protein